MSAVNLIGRFLKQRVRKDSSGTVLPAEVYAEFRTWCEVKGIQPIGRNFFYLELKTRHRRMVHPRRLGTKVYWVGIYLAQ